MASRNTQLPLFPQTPESDFSLKDLESEIQHIAERIQSLPASHMHEISELTVPSKATNPAKSSKKAVLREKEEIRPYPRISRRSRLLAAKADERFFSKYNIKAGTVNVRKQGLVSEPSPKPISLHIDPIPTRAETTTLEIDAIGETIADPVEPEAAEMPQRLSIKERIERYLAAPEDSPAPKPRRTTISERSQLWLQRRDEKLRGKTPPECTFSPVIYTKIPHHLHHLSAERLLEFTLEARKSPFNPRSSSRTSLPSSLNLSL